MSSTHKRLGRGGGDGLQAWLLLAPFLVFFILFVLYPVAQNIFYSFTNYNLMSAPKWVGLKNYQRLFRDSEFIQALINTSVYAAFSVGGLLVTGFMAALTLNRARKWAKGVRMIVLYPYATSMIAVSMVWLLMFDPNAGYLNKLIGLLGLRAKTWLFDPKLALGCLIFVNIWKNLGYVMLVILSGLQGVDESMYEAARVDGANSFGQALHITLPAIRPVMLFVSVTSCVESFKTFEQVQTMTRGDPLHTTTTIVHQIYLRGFGEYKMGYASAMSVVLLVILSVATIANFRSSGKAGGDGKGV